MPGTAATISLSSSLAQKSVELRPVAEMFGEASASSGAVDEVAALLAEPGALELLKAYAGLPRGVSRSALVEFVRSLRQPT